MKCCNLLLALCTLLISCSGPKPTIPETRIALGVKRGWLTLSDTYTIKADGSGESSVGLAIDVGSQPEWSPNGQWVVYSTVYQASKPDEAAIYVVQSTGKNRTLLTNNNGGGAFAPRWSPDGKEIAYYAYNQGSIYLLNIECILDNTPCNLIPDFLVQGRAPDWSPDGKQIAYESERPPSTIFLIYIDNPNKPINLSGNLSGCHEPRWSPNGEQLTFRCDDGLYIVDQNGSNLTLIESGTGSIHPDWSPDGKHIVFVSARDGLGKIIGLDDTVRSTSVFMMDTTGTNITRLSLRDDEQVNWFAWLPPPIDN